MSDEGGPSTKPSSDRRDAVPERATLVSTSSSGVSVDETVRPAGSLVDWLPPRTFPVTLRWTWCVAGLVAPLACLVAAGSGLSPTGDEPWQSGNLQHYVAMLLQFPALGPMLYPITVSWICLAIWLWQPASERHVLLRLGIYTGAVTSFYFFVLVTLTSGFLSVLAASLLGPLLFGMAYSAVRLWPRVRQFRLRHLLFVTTVTALTAALMAELRLWAMLPAFLLGFVAASPALNLLAYATSAAWIWWKVKTLPPLRDWGIATCGLAVWGSGSFVAWRASLDAMMSEYAKLPVTDPNCYVSAAARHRHDWLLSAAERAQRNRTLLSFSGTRGLPVSLQTKRLKFLELCLALLLPSLHRSLRTRYDAWGPSWARTCRSHAGLADVTYLLLTPAELIAELVRRTLGVPQAKIREMYESANRATELSTQREEWAADRHATQAASVLE